MIMMHLNVPMFFYHANTPWQWLWGQEIINNETFPFSFALAWHPKNSNFCDENALHAPLKFLENYGRFRLISFLVSQHSNKQQLYFFMKEGCEEFCIRHKETIFPSRGTNQWRKSSRFSLLPMVIFARTMSWRRRWWKDEGKILSFGEKRFTDNWIKPRPRKECEARWRWAEWKELFFSITTQAISMALRFMFRKMFSFLFLHT